MSAAACRFEAVPTRFAPDAPMVPALTPRMRSRYRSPWKVNVPEPPAAPRKNPTLAILIRTEPVAASEGDDIPASMIGAIKTAALKFIVRINRNIQVSALFLTPAQ